MPDIPTTLFNSGEALDTVLESSGIWSTLYSTLRQAAPRLMNWPAEKAVGLHIQSYEVPRDQMPGLSCDLVISPADGAFTVDAASVRAESWYSALETLGHVGLAGVTTRWPEPGAPRWVWCPEEPGRADAFAGFLTPADHRTARTRLERHPDNARHAKASVRITPASHGTCSAAWREAVNFVRALTISTPALHQPLNHPNRHDDRPHEVTGSAAPAILPGVLSDITGTAR